MRNFYLFFLVFLTVYGLINYYVGLRLLQTANAYITGINKYVYWGVFWIVALSYVSGRLLPYVITETSLSNFLTIIGSYWLGAFYYFILFFFLVDVINAIGKWSGVIAPEASFKSIAGLFTIGIVSLLLIYGAWNSKTTRVTKYEITIEKFSPIKELHIAAASDIHIGHIVGKRDLERLVNKINEINPDVVLLAGDIIDEDITPFVDQKMAETVKKLQPKYGIYASLGNHEYIGRHVEEAVLAMQEGGINVLRDKHIKIADSFYIVGRDDRSGERFGSSKRKDLSTLLSDVDKQLPVIILDHQPYNLDEVARSGVDLQLSGHTHYGQLFPNNFITSKIYEEDWGLLIKDKLHTIVSCGFGTWGPPIRIGSKSELLDITIRFTK